MKKRKGEEREEGLRKEGGRKGGLEFNPRFFSPPEEEERGESEERGKARGGDRHIFIQYQHPRCGIHLGAASPERKERGEGKRKKRRSEKGEERCSPWT